MTLNEIGNDIEVTCDRGRMDVVIKSMNMIIEFKSALDKKKLQDGVEQLKRYARNTGMSKVLIGLSPKSESKKIAIIEEINRLESINVNLEIHMFDPRTQKFDLDKILRLDRENYSDLQKNFIKTKQKFFEGLFLFFTERIPCFFNKFSRCIDEIDVIGLFTPSSQAQLKPSH